LIKHHEISEKHGGFLGQDATRIMLGALNLDSRKIGGEIARIPEVQSEDEKDIEKADLVIVHGMIVKWSAVKTIYIDEPVDENFVKKIKDWSYSRIPVIGRPEGDSKLEGKKIFGFLHIKVRLKFLLISASRP